MLMTLVITGPDLGQIRASWVGGDSAKSKFREDHILHRGHTLSSPNDVLVEENLNLVLIEAIGSEANGTDDVLNPGLEEGGAMDGLGDAER